MAITYKMFFKSGVCPLAICMVDRNTRSFVKGELTVDPRPILPIVPKALWDSSELKTKATHLSWEQAVYQMSIEGLKQGDGMRLIELCQFSPGWNKDDSEGHYIYLPERDIFAPYVDVTIDQDMTKHEDWRMMQNKNYELIPEVPAAAKNRSLNCPIKL